MMKDNVIENGAKPYWYDSRFSQDQFRLLQKTEPHALGFF